MQKLRLIPSPKPLFRKVLWPLKLWIHLLFFMPNEEMEDFVAFRTRYTKRLFKKLDESKATGNDRISAAILKRLSDQLAMPFTRICRRMFYEGCWPKAWKMHVIVPIYKRGSAFKAGNYRGVHLTSILSKLAEKVIGFRLVPFLQKNAFGTNQWLFNRSRSERSCDYAHDVLDTRSVSRQESWRVPG